VFQNSPERLIRETASGLYVHRCFDCGMKLQLQTLHSLVITAYHLASKGCQDEDMFGMLAYLLCLVSRGLDPQQKANVSVNVLLENDAIVECDHEHLTAAELAERVSASSEMGSWSTEVRSGWAVFCGVLSLCERNYPKLRTNDSNEEYHEEHHEDEEENIMKKIGRMIARTLLGISSVTRVCEICTLTTPARWCVYFASEKISVLSGRRLRLSCLHTDAWTMA
jgi:hypothetical protein